MGKNKKKSQQQQSGQKQTSNNNSKKIQKIFKVATSSNKKTNVAKEIPKKLKRLDLKAKDKADSQLKDLHLKMVSKKEKVEPKAVGKKRPTTNTENVQEILDKMDVK
ncbi:hypothetical protein PVAND_006141 [Polypedilum vanderplanki]|uniref:Uncharacterized protein n=2 Tax=Polypedilum vanderplanki TaxID=319348 RepID=A0A9J6C323_POLVA|nr:hypothetical protein PVAND_006141 [Polypedilum vanderplanki]